MNRYQDSFMKIKNWLYNFVNLAEVDESDLDEAINVAEELVDRATPKKPIVEIQNGIRHVDCPNCDDGYAHIYKGENELNDNNFCTNCGEAFDWSKDE